MQESFHGSNSELDSTDELRFRAECLVDEIDDDHNPQLFTCVGAIVSFVAKKKRVVFSRVVVGKEGSYCLHNGQDIRQQMLDQFLLFSQSTQARAYLPVQLARSF